MRYFYVISFRGRHFPRTLLNCGDTFHFHIDLRTDALCILHTLNRSFYPVDIQYPHDIIVFIASLMVPRPLEIRRYTSSVVTNCNRSESVVLKLVTCVRVCVCVFFTLNRSFPPSASSTPSVFDPREMQARVDKTTARNSCSRQGDAVPRYWVRRI